ncbi:MULTISPECIES: NAD(P)H-dependent oxidoreductase [unclassified Mesorhizobium]|uniref:NAD(P)H-dependent oxidoreductase n=1 Tax=unclassified Mesorhizobium TaxID=325217 RepID=UPI000FC9CAFA|nr:MULTISPECIES: NAD(P)H-dependent oxidoreductase [unclassified Mesorhizobium]RUZ82490.1 flavodoxin family protein [Mesorhizobium sp. M7A.F.Ca.US.003.02.2.1]MBZ9717906.1 NAD(P)H-dependent oxidoreductase [Mesorhizobium sp. AD1-1]RUY94297.1 flavodoxin family protein [Mesorhizobium sp. M7A.F.Ca.CA.001.12.2.1]RUZ15906.1 flavodoxin family protein [Mesorhizobium sp. M7A.F.Ca.US.007.01.2.1]RUZ35937.1 flavodoxin family protein [Mesorhizobium sp. M7A.F.Ca.US.003.02.1.1]
MSRRILIVVGHPDPSPDRLCRSLANAYGEGAEKTGHAVRRVDLAALDFPMLRTMQEFEHGTVPDELKDAVEAVVWADHILFVFPLWLGTMPAMLKAFLEQVMRPGTAFAYPERGGFTKTLLRGRSARVVVTMGMPSLVYRLWFLGHGIAGMKRSILHFVGISPVRETLFGMVAGASDATRMKWISQMRKLGERAL